MPSAGLCVRFLLYLTLIIYCPDEMMVMFVLYLTDTLSWISIAIAQWKTLSSDRLDISLHLDNLCWFRDNQSFFLFLQCNILGGEAANTNFKFFCFTQTVLDPMVYHTRGEPANHHTIDLLNMHITEIHRTVEWCPFASWVNDCCEINSPIT